MWLRWDTGLETHRQTDLCDFSSWRFHSTPADTPPKELSLSPSSATDMKTPHKTHASQACSNKQTNHFHHIHIHLEKRGLRGIVHPKMKSPSFTLPHIILNLFDFHKEDSIKKFQQGAFKLQNHYKNSAHVLHVKSSKALWKDMKFKSDIIWFGHCLFSHEHTRRKVCFSSNAIVHFNFHSFASKFHK